VAGGVSGQRGTRHWRWLHATYVLLFPWHYICGLLQLWTASGLVLLPCSVGALLFVATDVGVDRRVG
jgi:hypothetical protein